MNKPAAAASAALAAGMLAAVPAWSQAYPSRPVRVVVPAAAGGPTDVPGRLVADGLGRTMGQRFVIENRVGAGGIIGAEAVAKSAPDGYTLLYANTSVLAVVPALQGAKLPYDPAAFSFIGFVSNSPQVLVGNPRLPYRNLKDVLAFAKANPGKVNWAVSGVGTLPHLTYELLKLETGIKAEGINYSGGGPALVAVQAGQADVLFDIMGPKVKSGEVRPLAVTGPARIPEIPDVPTVAEMGLPALTTTSGTGLVGPGGLPRDIVSALNTRLNELLKNADFLAKMRNVGLFPSGGTPEDFASWATEQRQKWTRVVKDGNVKVE
jgi:tripartite-type tricarboxylate transporter receptor subunit TctC